MGFDLEEIRLRPGVASPATNRHPACRFPKRLAAMRTVKLKAVPMAKTKRAVTLERIRTVKWR